MKAAVRHRYDDPPDEELSFQTMAHVLGLLSLLLTIVLKHIRTIIFLLVYVCLSAHWSIYVFISRNYMY